MHAPTASYLCGCPSGSYRRPRPCSPPRRWHGRGWSRWSCLAAGRQVTRRNPKASSACAAENPAEKERHAGMCRRSPRPVLPSPAASLVLLATERTSCAPRLWCLFSTAENVRTVRTGLKPEKGHRKETRCDCCREAYMLLRKAARRLQGNCKVAARLLRKAAVRLLQVCCVRLQGDCTSAARLLLQGCVQVGCRAATVRLQSDCTSAARLLL
jgi:hypothetical protein